MTIRKVKPADEKEWERTRNLLWPADPGEHLADIRKFLVNEEIELAEVFVLERSPGKLGGFIELNFRNYAEGSTASRVPYVEGWYVDTDLRGRGYGRQLIEAAVAWAKEQGYNELASDAALDNDVSIAAHKAVGFREVERTVCFIKKW